jgi:YbbR domain-containing protein
MEGPVIFRLLRYIFIEDYLAKLICLAIGSGLWFYVEFARVAQTTLNIPVEYIKKPANLYLKPGQPRFVKIVVRGREEFLKFSTAGIKAEVNLADAKNGEGRYPLVFDTRQFPERVELVTRPEYLTVALEKGLSRVLPVRVLTTGSPDPQFRVLRISALPQQIEVDGPEAAVSALQSLETEPVDIEGISRNTSRKATLRIPEQISVDKVKSVSVRIELIQKTSSEEKQFEQIPLKVQNLDAALNAALSDNVVSLLVQGEAGAVKKLKSSDFYAWVNVEDTRYNSRTGNILPYANESGVPVKARILSGNKKVQIVAITPDKVNIRFSVKPEYAKRTE